MRFGSIVILSISPFFPSISYGQHQEETDDWISPEYKWIFEFPLPIPPVKSSKFTWTGNGSGALIDYYEVEVRPLTKQIYPDLPATPMVGYDGIVPGPTFVMPRGREAVVRFLNNGYKNMSAHVHGQYNRAPFDGFAADMASPGQYKDYYYPNQQNAQTLWYHDHTEFQTGQTVYHGQEGFYLITDTEEQAIGLPSGDYDVPLALGSAIYNTDGTLNFETNGGFGLFGDIIQVNGQPWPYFNVEPRLYRFRMLNGACSRTYDLSFNTDDGDAIDFNVIASDSGLFSAPVPTSSLGVAMGERYEILFDFSNYANSNITLLNGHGLGQNKEYAATDRVMRFVVGSESGDSDSIPPTLHSEELPPLSPEVAKDFTFFRSDNGLWLINGIGFRDIAARILTRPVRGTDEIWTLRNGAGGGTHPVHIHLVDFKVLSRSGSRNTVPNYEAAGWKDIVWLAPGETAQVAARYAPWDGVYMFHCHNLVHEDNDMLGAFNVTSLANWGYTNDTLFIDPLQPEFRPQDYSESAYTQSAIEEKIAWLWSTNPYNHGNVQGVEAALSAYSEGIIMTQASSTQPANASATHISQTGKSSAGSSNSWTTVVSSRGSPTAAMASDKDAASSSEASPVQTSSQAYSFPGGGYYAAPVPSLG